MKRLLLSACLLLPPMIATAAAVKTPEAAKPTEITLSGSGTAKPIGVEPVGGRFQRLLTERAKAGESAEAKFSTTSSHQEKSTLAIFGSDLEAMHDEKPLARVEIAGLRPGEQKDRIRVKLTVVSPRKLSVEAWDASTNRPLSVRQLSSAEVLQTKYNSAPQQRVAIVSGNTGKRAPIASRDAKPAPIASRDARKPAPIGSLDRHPSDAVLAQSIGVRAAGGLMQPLLAAGAAEGTTKSYYLRPRYPDQTTADITLFAGDSPYIENNKVWQRYLISGMPAGANRRLKLDFTVGSNGKLTAPKATELTSKHELRVEKYSDSAAQRLEEAPRPSEPAARRIPAAPGA